LIPTFHEGLKLAQLTYLQDELYIESFSQFINLIAVILQSKQSQSLQIVWKILSSVHRTLFPFALTLFLSRASGSSINFIINTSSIITTDDKSRQAKTPTSEQS